MSSLIKGVKVGDLAAAVALPLGARASNADELPSPKIGAAAVRELTRPEPIVISRGNRTDAEFRAHGKAVAAGIEQPDSYALPTVADVENDGNRGPRAARDPLSVLDQAADAARAKAVQRLMVAVAALSVDEVAALAWVAGELPGARLRRRCEEATATGWCGSDVTKSPPAGRRTAEDGTRAALLAAWRQVVALVHGARSTASEDLRQRTREDVLADEAQRRAGGAK
jgi:hypothetical protein